MKAILFDLYGTLLRLPESSLSIENEFKELILKGKTSYRTDGMKGVFQDQIENVELYEDARVILPIISSDPDTLCLLVSNLSEEFGICISKLKFHEDLIPIFSYQIGAMKPEREIYQHALDIISLVPEVTQIYMVGDSYINDYQAPREHVFTDKFTREPMNIQSYWLNRDGKKTRDIHPNHEVQNLFEFYEKIKD